MPRTPQPTTSISDKAFRRFFETAADLLCIADLEGFIRHVNPAWERSLGWSGEDICGRPYLDFVHPDDVDATLRTPYADAVRRPSGWGCSMRRFA